MKNFITMSRGQVKRYTYKSHTEDYIIVSINEPNEKPPRFNRNIHLKDVLYLYFEDISEISDNHITMSNQDAINILEFIDKHKDIDNIIIHCVAGVSRSVSIRCALEEIYNNRVIGEFPKNEKIDIKVSFSLEELIDKKDDMIYIFNRLCYEKVKEMYRARKSIIKYRNEPLLFIEECLGIKLLDWQKKFLKMYYKIIK